MLGDVDLQKLCKFARPECFTAGGLLKVRQQSTRSLGRLAFTSFDSVKLQALYLKGPQEQQTTSGHLLVCTLPPQNMSHVMSSNDALSDLTGLSGKSHQPAQRLFSRKCHVQESVD